MGCKFVKIFLRPLIDGNTGSDNINMGYTAEF